MLLRLGGDMRRRKFLGLVGTVAAFPVVSLAQQAIPVIGFLNSQSLATFGEPVASFRQGLRETGYVDGQNVRIEYRWAEGRAERLPQLADDLVHRQLALIVATAASYAVVRRAGARGPIVATFGGDPVRQGLVASLNKPGGNVTGVNIITSALEAKRLELMHELLPNAPVVGVLLDANFSDPEGQLRQVHDTAGAIRQRIRPIPVARESDIDAAFATLVDAGATALVVTGSPFLSARRGQIISLAARHRLAAIYENRESVSEGGLMSYGTSIPRVYHQLGIYAGRVLQGAKPADLPIVQPTKFDIAVNLTTAKALELEIPTSILLRADEVIE
jgi:putative ABC transport system substrate-binding protein